jgi:hypothetical protein
MAKGETVMPTPEGIITTSDIYVTEAQVEEAQDIADFDIASEKNEETITWEEVKKDLGIEIDLPELS